MSAEPKPPYYVAMSFCPSCGWSSFYDTGRGHERVKSRTHLPDGSVSAGVQCETTPVVLAYQLVPSDETPAEAGWKQKLA